MPAVPGATVSSSRGAIVTAHGGADPQHFEIVSRNGHYLDHLQRSIRAHRYREKAELRCSKERLCVNIAFRCKAMEFA
jgi:hypothetical protein